MNFLKHYFGILIVVLFSFIGIIPLFQSGFFPMHDDTQIARVFTMAQSLRDGMFPVRWVSDLGYGYGYPLFNFYAPLAYYVGGVFVIIGFSVLTSTKIMMGLGFILAGISMYILAREIFGRDGGILAGVLYVYAPYHGLNLYVRGAIAELWAYAFIPFIFWGIWKVYKEKSLKYIVLTAVSIAFLFLSHNLTAFMVMLFLAVICVVLGYISVRKNTFKQFFLIIISIALGISLASFYWIPMVFEMQYTNVSSQIGGGADFHDHFVCATQLWQSQWGYGGSVPGCTDGLSFKIGKFQAMLFFMSFFLFIFFYRHYKKYTYVLVFSTGGLILSLFLLLPMATTVWETVPGMPFIQYPWRFLLLVSFFLSFTSGFLGTVIADQMKKNHLVISIIIFILSISIIGVNKEAFTQQSIFSLNEQDATSKNAILWLASKTSDEYMPKGFLKPQTFDAVPKEPFSLLNGIGEITIKEKNVKKTIANLTLVDDTTVHLHTAYYPSWRLLIDGKETPLKIERNGMSVLIPKGNHVLELFFAQTSAQIAGNMISVASIVLVIIAIIYTNRKKIYG